MPLRESSATALVRLTGLAIILFNREKRRSEIAFIRDDKHKLDVRVQTPTFQDGSGNDVIVYKDVAVYENLPKNGVSIEIRAQGGRAAGDPQVYQPGHFDRLGDSDPNDFRWIVKMESLHGDAAPLAPTGRRRHPLTRLDISPGLFYTHTLDTDLFFEKLEKDGAGRVLRREVFGNVGETLGVLLEGDEVSFEITIGGHRESHTLRRVEGLPHRIVFRNMNYDDNAVYSDMADYYGYLSSPDGRQFDFAPVLEEEGEGAAHGGSVNQKDFCHPVVADLPSADAL